MKGADLRICQGHRLVLLAPTTPLALAPLVVVAALVLVPLVAALVLAPWVAASLRTSLATSLRTSLRTSALAGASSRSGGSVAGASGRTRAGALAVASSGNAGGVARFCGASGSGAVLSSGVVRGGGTRRGSAGAVELTLDEGESVLAVLSAIALVGGLVAAVTAVRVSAVAVGLHLGAGLLEIVSMKVVGGTSLLRAAEAIATASKQTATKQDIDLPSRCSLMGV